MRPGNITPVVHGNRCLAFAYPAAGICPEGRGGYPEQTKKFPRDSGQAENGTASAGPGGEPVHNFPGYAARPPCACCRSGAPGGSRCGQAPSVVPQRPVRVFRSGLVGSGLSLQHLILTIEAIRSGSRIDIPDDNKRFADTLAGAVATAIVTLDFDGEINRALDEQDYRTGGGAASVLPDPRPGKLTPATTKRYEEENSTAAQWWRNGADLIKGAVTGRSDGIAGMAGALAVDLGIPFRRRCSRCRV